MGRLRRFKKRVTESIRAITCCFPRRSNKVAPEVEAVSVEAEMKSTPVAETEATTQAEASSPRDEPVVDETKDDVSLTKSEDEMAEQVVELAIKASLSSALDDLL